MIHAEITLFSALDYCIDRIISFTECSLFFSLFYVRGLCPAHTRVGIGTYPTIKFNARGIKLFTTSCQFDMVQSHPLSSPPSSLVLYASSKTDALK